MPQDPKFWLELLHWACTVLLATAIWLRKPGVEAGVAVAALEAKHGQQLAEHSKQLALHEERMQHMPTSEELAELEGTVKTIAAQMEGLGESMGTVRLQLNRIETYLLDRKG